MSFVCGHRALTAIVQRQGVLDHLVSTLSAPLDELVAAAQKAKDDLLESERRARGLLERALEGEARRLLTEVRGDGPPPTPAAPSLVVAAFEGWPPSDLRVLATHLVALAPCVALLGSRADKAHLVFAQSERLPHDVPALLRAAVEHLGGKGGGRGNIAQGGGDRLDRLDEALARAARRRPRSPVAHVALAHPVARRPLRLLRRDPRAARRRPAPRRLVLSRGDRLARSCCRSRRATRVDRGRRSTRSGGGCSSSSGAALALHFATLGREPLLHVDRLVRPPREHGAPLRDPTSRALFLHEKPSVVVQVAIPIAFAGAALIAVGDWAGSPGSLLGNALAVAAR